MAEHRGLLGSLVQSLIDSTKNGPCCLYSPSTVATKGFRVKILDNANTGVHGH